MMPTQTFKVAAVQTPAGSLDRPGDFDQLADLTAEAAGQGARLVAWCECAYPAYFLGGEERYRRAADRRLAFVEALDRAKEIARANGIHLVAGLVEETDDGRLANAAILLDPAGRELARHRKHVLWHFDSDWFVQGVEPAIAETELGRIGLMICADGRSPELLGELGRRGAQLIVNPTAWVSWGRTPADLGNLNIDCFIPARALETGAWYLSANKIGVEADSIVYCGRSNLVSPAGERVAELAPDASGVLVAEVDLSACREPATGAWDPLLAEPTADLPITARLAEPLDSADPVWLAAVAGTPSDALPGDLAAQSVALLVLGPQPDPDPSARWADWMQRLDGSGIIPCFAGQVDRPVRHRGLWIAGGPVESFVPARAAMLGGVDVFIADAPDGRCPDIRLLRTRAAENRIYVVAAADDRAVVIDPAGRVLADSLAGRDMAVAAGISPAATREKLIVPGTHAVNARTPEAYRRWMET